MTVIRFDRYEEDRLYLGFTEVELDVILTALEKNLPDDEITNRIDLLAMAFRKRKIEERESTGKE